MGYDIALTHSSFIAYDDTRQFTELFTYDRKSDKQNQYVISYRSDSIQDMLQRADNIYSKFLESLKKNDIQHIATLAIDYDPKVFFNTSRIQAIYTAILLGYLVNKFKSDSGLISNVVLVSPSEIRGLFGLKRNSSKGLVHKAYIDNPKLPTIPDSFNEDSRDAAILAFYASIQDYLE